MIKIIPSLSSKGKQKLKKQTTNKQNKQTNKKQTNKGRATKKRTKKQTKKDKTKGKRKETSYSPPDAFMEDTIRHNTAQMTSSKA